MQLKPAIEPVLIIVTPFTETVQPDVKFTVLENIIGFPVVL